MGIELKKFTNRLLVVAICMIALAMIMVIPAGAILQVEIYATDTVDTTSNHVLIVDNDGVYDQDTVIGTITLANGFEPIPDVPVMGSYHTSTHGVSENTLTSGSSSVTNNRSNPININVAVSDTDFDPEATLASITGSGTFTNAVGSMITMGYYDDPENVQGANVLNGGVFLPGNLIKSETYTATKPLDSFSFSEDNIAVSDTEPYSMTLNFDFNLVPKGMLTSRGEAISKNIIGAPEFPTFALPIAMVVGLIGIMIVIKKRDEEE